MSGVVNNEDRFYFCKQCLSLHIKRENGIDYCADCGSTDINIGNSMDRWLDRYLKLHNIKENKKYYYSNRRTFR